MQTHGQTDAKKLLSYMKTGSRADSGQKLKFRHTGKTQEIQTQVSQTPGKPQEQAQERGEAEYTRKARVTEQVKLHRAGQAIKEGKKVKRP